MVESVPPAKSECYLSLIDSTGHRDGFYAFEEPETAIKLIACPSQVAYVSTQRDLALCDPVVADYYTIVGDEAYSASLVEHFRGLDKKYSMHPGLVAASLYCAVYRKGLLYPVRKDHLEVVRLYELNRACDRPASPDPFGLDFVCSRLRREIPFGKIFRNKLVLSSAGSFNYGHWLVDDLTRVYVYLDDALSAGRDIDFDGVLLPSYRSIIDKVRRRSLRWLFKSLAVKYPHDSRNINRLRLSMVNFNKTILVENPTVISPTSYHPVLMHKRGLLGIRDLAHNFQASKNDSCSAPPRRIFVSRRGTRQIVNLAEVEAKLVEMGFETVYPEDLSFSSQVSTFFAAELVVGVMGAAMTNLLFCQPSSRIIILTPSAWHEPFYRTLGNALSQNIISLLGRSSLDAKSQSQHIHLQGFYVDTALLSHCIMIPS
jgi:hypothetical protein